MAYSGEEINNSLFALPKNNPPWSKGLPARVKTRVNRIAENVSLRCVAERLTGEALGKSSFPRAS